jgi:hypothetical protein
MMSFSQAIIAFDLGVLLLLAADFALFSRRDDTVLAKGPALLMLAVLAVMAWRVSANRIEFIALGGIVLGAAIFGYANFLAFVKRGVTFSILSNHTRPAGQRIPDHEFIAIDDRLVEMQNHGWAEAVEGRWRLTTSGRRVAALRRFLMRVLRIEAVG